MPHPKKLLIFKFSALSLLALMSILLYMLYRLGGSWEFALETRAVKLAALLLTAIAVAVSTLLFQTLTKNRILTPSIMGLDSLYMLLQTALVYFLGSSTQFLASKNINFLVTLLLMMVFSFLLYYILFGRLSHSIFTLLL
ncbi:iron chelate uptake ABC transporter family permease subunit, partial [Escherichia coli]|nr:iron chelate uptake ABC transporter family permease subunit [Escherichia coli]